MGMKAKAWNRKTLKREIKGHRDHQVEIVVIPNSFVNLTVQAGGDENGSSFA